MGYLPPATVADTLRRIQKGELILPAIQREYVWKPAQVIGLFDSLMRGYPIGSFLSWRVEPATVARFRFYGFLKDYSEFDARHNPTLDMPPGISSTAVLDGQQRLTSLNVGLRGTYAYRLQRSWSRLKENYPTRRLYLNVLSEAEQNEAGLRYDFRFLTPNQLEAAQDDQLRHWFPVHRVYEMTELGDLWDLAGEAGLANDRTARGMLSQLWKAVHSATSVHFYEEEEQDVERVLDIFIRVNSAGTVLSYSDLLLSIATAQWKERDARSAIHGLVDALNSTGAGFSFTQDVVLKAGLLLAGIGDFAFKVKNFTAENMVVLDQEWDRISDSLRLAAGLLSDFGLSGATLTARSVLIPVAYYVHRRQLTQKYREYVAEAGDRQAMRSWVLRSLIVPGVWGSGLDTLLRDLRQVIDEQGRDRFPATHLERRMATRGKALTITPDVIEDLLGLAYGEPRTFAVLALIFPHVNTRNVHHVDHVVPQSRLTRSALTSAGLSPDVVAQALKFKDLLPNLQLLEGLENIAKSDATPKEWAASALPSAEGRQAYLDRNEIPWLPDGATEFGSFFAARRDALARRIALTIGTALPATAEQPGADGADGGSIAANIDEELALVGDAE